MPRAAQVPDIRKVDLPEARQAIPYVHAYLRECILDGTLTPGTKLSQVSLARQLGISRTPLREVLRMLQEEGLGEIEPNQRTRVSGLDPQELDDVYAIRILLETVRNPDEGMPDFPLGLTMGMMLSVPMILVGAWLLWRAFNVLQPPAPSAARPGCAARCVAQ